MGIISVIKNIKEIHKKDVIMVKIGNFYYSYGKDAYIISYMYKYKIKQIEGNIYACAFPINNINKIMSNLENKKINYIIVDRKNNYRVDEQSDNKNLNNYDNIYKKADKYIKSKRKIDYIYKYLMDNIEKEINEEIITEIGKIINETRKI